MIDRSDSLYDTVEAERKLVKEQVPGDGKTWEISRFVGSGAYLSTTTVKLIWDHGGPGEEVIGSTHGDANVELVRGLVGDGVKKLALILENNAGTDQSLGARYEAKEL